MSWDLVVFYMLAAVSVLGGAGVVTARNPVHAGIFLVISFFNSAGIFVMLGAEFLAVVQVIVYAGAILVLLLFVLMLVDTESLPQFYEGRPVQRTVGMLLGLILLLELGVAILNRSVVGPQGPATPEAVALVGGNTQALGRFLYSDYLLAFEVASLILLVGVIGAIVLALPERLGERVSSRRGTISLGHPRGVDLALPSGPRGETPIPGAMAAEAREAAAATGSRDLIMVKDADDYTTIGGKTGRREDG